MHENVQLHACFILIERAQISITPDLPDKELRLGAGGTTKKNHRGKLFPTRAMQHDIHDSLAKT